MERCGQLFNLQGQISPWMLLLCCEAVGAYSSSDANCQQHRSDHSRYPLDKACSCSYFIHCENGAWRFAVVECQCASYHASNFWLGSLDRLSLHCCGRQFNWQFNCQQSQRSCDHFGPNRCSFFVDRCFFKQFINSRSRHLIQFDCTI